MSNILRSIWRALDDERFSLIALALVPALFGLYSVMLGVDANWDLRNYHLYNGYAVLHGRMNIDLAPGGMQSYFNPTLDAVYYWLVETIPARAVGFVMGAVQGLAFIPLLAIARACLRQGDGRNRVALLLSAAGVLSTSFLTELGGTMGDATTSVLVLVGVAMLVAGWASADRGGRRGIVMLACGGVAIGLAVGLKLTNAPYTVGAALAVLVQPGALSRRAARAAIFAAGVASAFALTGGIWMWHMWERFGNPLYPQFGRVFPNPMTLPGGSGDTRWLPRTWGEAIAWPILFTAMPRRLGELPLRNFLWPIWYCLTIGFMALAVRRREILRPASMATRRPTSILLTFIVTSYVAWMGVFSIYRYIVPIEMLLPLAIFVLLSRICRPASAAIVAGRIIAVATVLSLAFGLRTWGHEGWADPPYRAETPPLAGPGVAVIYSRLDAWSWLAPMFPATFTWTRIDSAFPAAPPFYAQVRNLVAGVHGNAFAVLDAAHERSPTHIDAIDAVLRASGITRTGTGCELLRSTIDRLRLRARVEAAAGGDAACRLLPRPKEPLRSDAAIDNAIAEDAVRAFAARGLVLDAASCVTYRAYIGTGLRPYQWCRVHP